MLVLRPEQVEAFENVAEAAFEQRVVEYLRENHPDEVVRLPSKETCVAELTDEELRRMVRHGIKRARGYGQTWESSITSFIVLMFTIAPNFDEHPLIRRVLKDKEIAADLRLEEIWDYTTEENWEAAHRNYSPDGWNLGSEES